MTREYLLQQSREIDAGRINEWNYEAIVRYVNLKQKEIINIGSGNNALILLESFAKQIARNDYDNKTFPSQFYSPFDLRSTRITDNKCFHVEPVSDRDLGQTIYSYFNYYKFLSGLTEEKLNAHLALSSN